MLCVFIAENNIVFTGAPNDSRMNMHSTDGGYTVWGSTLHIDVDNVSIHLIIGIFIGVPIYSCTVPHTQKVCLFIACSTLACNACIVIVFASGCWRKICGWYHECPCDDLHRGHILSLGFWTLSKWRQWQSTRIFRRLFDPLKCLRRWRGRRKRFDYANVEHAMNKNTFCVCGIVQL